MFRLKPPIASAVASAALTASVVGGVAIAQTSAPAVITACVAENSGNVRIVSSASDCKANETVTTWNEQDVPGPDGPAGQDATAPVGAVMFFNLSSCPSGWTEMTSARGRYLVGLPSDGTLGGTAGSVLSNLENRAVGSHTHTVSDPGHRHGLDVMGEFVAGGTYEAEGGVGAPVRRVLTEGSPTGISINTAGTVDGTNAPYLQLLVCQKD